MNNIFLLFNFGFIGSAIAFGIGLSTVLHRKKKPAGQRIEQLLVGIYLMGFLGLMNMINMRIKGFFFYFLSGIIGSSLIHYLVAKILGPVIFGRGFCGWACWTAMVPDSLPYKRDKRGRLSAKWELLR